MFVEILSTSTKRNVWRKLRRICILTLGLKGLIVLGCNWSDEMEAIKKVVTKVSQTH